MVKGLYTAHTGMVNEMKRMDVLANNLANSDTYGFKKEGTTSHSFKNELAIKDKGYIKLRTAQKSGQHDIRSASR